MSRVFQPSKRGYEPFAPGLVGAGSRSPRRLKRILGFLGVGLLLSAAPAFAEGAVGRSETARGAPGRGLQLNTEEPHEGSGLGFYLHGYAGFGVGAGLRLNNPYRLATPLGDTAESLSMSAFYADFSLGALFGGALGFQHGGQLAIAWALEGVPQQVFTPSYVLYRRFGPLLAAQGRFGVPLVLGPDAGAGLEAGVAGLMNLRGGVALQLELIYSQFYGAATPDVSLTIIPIVSAQLGLRVAYEVFP